MDLNIFCVLRLLILQLSAYPLLCKNVGFVYSAWPESNPGIKVPVRAKVYITLV